MILKKFSCDLFFLSNVMTSYFFSVGSEYLVEVLSPLVEMISNYEHSLEVDPSKSKEDVSENSPYLKEVAQNFFNAIISSADRCPEYVHHWYLPDLFLDP